MKLAIDDANAHAVFIYHTVKTLSLRRANAVSYWLAHQRPLHPSLRLTVEINSTVSFCLPAAMTCYFCVNVSSNYMCNRFAIDVPCPTGTIDLHFIAIFSPPCFVWFGLVVWNCFSSVSVTWKTAIEWTWHRLFCVYVARVDDTYWLQGRTEIVILCIWLLYYALFCLLKWCWNGRP